MFHLENGTVLPSEASIDICAYENVPSGFQAGIIGVNRGVMVPCVGNDVVIHERTMTEYPTVPSGTHILRSSRLVSIDEGTRRCISHGHNGGGAGRLTWEYSRGEWTIVEWDAPVGQPWWDARFQAWLIMPDNAPPYLTKDLIPFSKAPKSARQTFRLR